jgi:3',5'-cyclic AMP phosphodiesterase CpdA
MPELPSELHQRCRSTFLKCSEFNRDASLRAVFVTAELRPFQHGLPEAASKKDRVAQCLDFLLPKRLSDGRPLLPLFLTALRNKYEPGDALRDELETLFQDVQSVLNSSNPPFIDTSSRRSRQTHRPQIVTWLHISDLHFSTEQTYDANVVLQALLQDISERIQQDGLCPDFIAVTGDIAFSGKSDEYDLAQRFFDDLLVRTKLSKNRLFIVPGNHDVDRNLITPGAKAIGAALTNRNSVNILLATLADRQLMMARFKGYEEFVNDYFAGPLAFDDKRYFYVHTLTIAGQTVALLGLNSAWLCASDKDKAQGLVIGERQARTTLEQSEDTDMRIALLHHPFDWLREFDQNDSAALLLDNCDFILHGHLHRSATTQLVSPDSGAMIIAGGACYETRQYPNTYNFVRLDLSAGSGTVYLRRYSDERGGFWAKDTLTYKGVPNGVYDFALHSKPTEAGQRRSTQTYPNEVQESDFSKVHSKTYSPAELEALAKKVARSYGPIELADLAKSFGMFTPLSLPRNKLGASREIVQYVNEQGRLEELISQLRSDGIL